MKILIWILLVGLVYDVNCLPQGRLKIKITEEDASGAARREEGSSFDSDDDFLESGSTKGQPTQNPFGSLLNFNFFGEDAAKTFSDAHKVVEAISKLALDQVKSIGNIALLSTNFINQSTRSTLSEIDEDNNDDAFLKNEKVVGVYRKKSVNEPTPLQTSGNIFEGILGSGLKLFTDSLNFNRVLPQPTFVNNVNTRGNSDNDDDGIYNRGNQDNDNNEINSRRRDDNDNNEVNSRRRDNNDNNEVNSRRNEDDNNEINTRNKDNSERNFDRNDNGNRGRSINSSKSISRIINSRSTRKSKYQDDSDFLSDI